MLDTEGSKEELLTILDGVTDEEFAQLPRLRELIRWERTAPFKAATTLNSLLQERPRATPQEMVAELCIAFRREIQRPQLVSQLALLLASFARHQATSEATLIPRFCKIIKLPPEIVTWLDANKHVLVKGEDEMKEVWVSRVATQIALRAEEAEFDITLNFGR